MIICTKSLAIQWQVIKSCVVDWHRVVALSYNVVHSVVSSSVPGHTGSVSSSGTGGRVAAVEAATWQSILR